MLHLIKKSENFPTQSPLQVFTPECNESVKRCQNKLNKLLFTTMDFHVPEQSIAPFCTGGAKNPGKSEAEFSKRRNSWGGGGVVQIKVTHLLISRNQRGRARSKHIRKSSHRSCKNQTGACLVTDLTLYSTQLCTLLLPTQQRSHTHPTPIFTYASPFITLRHVKDEK